MLQWIGTVLVMAMQFAIHFDMAYSIVLVLSVMSSIVWIAAAIRTKNRALVVTNVICLAFAIAGAIR